MPLSAEQKAMLAPIKRMLEVPDWSNVQQGLVLLEALNDAALWAHVSKGVLLQASGRLSIGKGYLMRTVKPPNRSNAALFLASRTKAAESITRLDLSDHPQLSDISMLERMTSLTHLTLLFTAVQDLSPLAQLSALTTLRMGAPNTYYRQPDPPDFSTLSGLSSLTTLMLVDFRTLQDLRPLARLTALTHLDLSGCTAVADLAPLQALTALTTLNLCGCTQVTELSPLKALSALTALNCWGSGVPVAPELDQPRDGFGVPFRVGDLVLYNSRLRRVSEVLTHNKDHTRRVRPKVVFSCGGGVEHKLDEATVVSTLGQLCASAQTPAAMIAGQLLALAPPAPAEPAAVLSPEQQAQLSAVRQGKQTTLDLRGAPLKDLSILRGLTALTSLNLGKCLFLTDTSALSTLSGLEDLQLSNCKSLEHLTLTTQPKLRSLSISNCKSLQTLTLSDCPSLTKITGLKPALTRLSTLKISRCAGLETLALDQIKKLRTLALQDLPNLTSLSMDACEVSSLSGLQRLPRLTTLSISDMHILTGPQAPSALTTITMMRANYVYSLQWLSALQELTTLQVVATGYPGNRALTDLSGLKGLPNLTRIALVWCTELVSLRALHGLPKLAVLRLIGCRAVTNEELGKLHDTLPQECVIQRA